MTDLFSYPQHIQILRVNGEINGEFLADLLNEGVNIQQLELVHRFQVIGKGLKRLGHLPDMSSLLGT